MSNKIFGILLGVLLILGGIFYFFRDEINISYSAVCAVFLGIAFIVMYFKSKRKWTILPGIYLLYLGLARVLLSDIDVYSYVVTANFFLAPGTIFLILYFTSSKKGAFLTFGTILCSIGASVILSGIYDFQYINIFLLSIGIGFVLNYILSFDFKNSTPLVVGIILVLLSTRKVLSMTGYTDVIISLALVMLGFVVIITTLFNKEV